MDENNQKLLKLRQKIDIIDTKLIELIEDRSNLAKEIIKAKSGENIFKPEREETLIKDIIKRSNSSNPEFIERVWRLLISENLFLQGGLRISVGSSIDAYKYVCAFAYMYMYVLMHVWHVNICIYMYMYPRVHVLLEHKHVSLQEP